MTEGRKMKKRIECEDRLIDGCTLRLRDNSTEEPQHRRERSEEQGSVTMLRNEQQCQGKQQRESRSTSPPARREVTRHPLHIKPWSIVPYMVHCLCEG